MSAVGSLVFCTACGNLLDISTGDSKNILICDCCGAENKDNASKTIVTKSNPSSFPSALRSKRSIFQRLERTDLENTQKAQETCTACGRTEVTFVSVQLRSADEGSTIFYTCDCGNKWNTNN